MKKFALTVCISLLITSQAKSQDIQQLQVAYSSCLMAALEKEREKENHLRSVASIKKKCSAQIQAFHAAIGPQMVAQIPFDKKLMEELKK